MRVNVKASIFTSTTSAFGDANRADMDQPVGWSTEDILPVAKNIYGVTKVAAENLYQQFHRNQKLRCLIFRASRFFHEKMTIEKN